MMICNQCRLALGGIGRPCKWCVRWHLALALTPLVVPLTLLILWLLS